MSLEDIELISGVRVFDEVPLVILSEDILLRKNI
jgi:hypothetical protein